MKISMAWRIGWLLLAGLLLAACAGGGAAGPLVVALEGHEFAFSAAEITVPAGQPVVVRFQNAGLIDHALAFDEWGVATETLRPGESAEVRFRPQEAGRFPFYCAVPGHEAAGMAGVLVVTP